MSMELLPIFLLVIILTAIYSATIMFLVHTSQANLFKMVMKQNHIPEETYSPTKLMEEYKKSMAEQDMIPTDELDDKEMHDVLMKELGMTEGKNEEGGPVNV